MRKYFGTDGIRGVVGKELTAEIGYRVGAAGAYVFKKNGHCTDENIKVIIGTDTRISKDLLSSAISAGAMSVGANVIDVGIIPTPGVAYLIRKYNADIGIVISASHNPSEYNGIKIFNSNGFKLADEIEEEIEYFIDFPYKIDSIGLGVKLGGITPEEDYITFLTNCIQGNLEGLKLTMDCSNGAAYHIAPEVYSRLGAEVNVIHNSPDGYNINQNCGSTHLEHLQQEVLKNGSDMGIAYDGDADRFLAVDNKGNIVDGDQILLISAAYLKERNRLKNNTLVVTVMSNLGLKIAAKNLGIDLAITNVGDRYVLEKMLKDDYCVGGEQSGHMIFKEFNTTGDGILSSLILCEILKHTGKDLFSLSKIMTVYPQVLYNAKVKAENKAKYLDDDEIQNKIKLIEEKFNGEGRVLIRPSGTEPLIRVMIEGKDYKEIETEAKRLSVFIEDRLS